MNKSSLSPAKYGPLPLLIGVTGHRNLRAEDIVELEKRVLSILQEIQTKYPYTPLVVISPLADGADRLVARVALQIGLKLQAPLPMPRELYITDFNDAARVEFEEIEKKAEQVFELPLIGGNSEDDIRQHGPARNRQYDAVGAYIARHSQVLIALWDGEPSQKVGGTADIVRWRLTELPLAASSRLHPPDPVHSEPVIQIVTPREGREPPKAPFTVVRHFPKVALHGEVPEPTYTKIFERIDKFNRDVIEHTDEASLQKSRGFLFPDTKMASLPAPMQRTRKCFAAADVLAGNYQKHSRISLKWILALVFASVMTFEVVEQALGMFQWAMLAYPAVLGVAYAIYYWARWQDYQNKYQDYRALAEGMRVQFFWRLAGRTESVEANYLRQQRSELNWIRTALRVFWGLQGGDFESIMATAKAAQAERLQWVLTHWIEDQNTFYSGRAASETHKSEQLEKRIQLGFAIGIIISLLIGTLFVLMFRVESIKEYFHHNHAESLVSISGILVVLVTLPFVAATVVHAYSQYRALEQQARQYKIIKRLFANGRQQWQVMTQAATVDTSTADLLGLIEELGKEALVENADWVLLHRERPLEVPHGK